VQSAAVQRRPGVLLVGEPGMVHDSTAEFLRVHGYYVMQTFAADRARDVLLAEDSQFRGVMILAGPAEVAFLSLAGELRGLVPELKVVLQLVGGESDLVPAELLPQIHLLIASDMDEEAMVRNLKLLFE
jgi:hypothetical protein